MSEEISVSGIFRLLATLSSNNYSEKVIQENILSFWLIRFTFKTNQNSTNGIPIGFFKSRVISIRKSIWYIKEYRWKLCYDQVWSSLVLSTLTVKTEIIYPLAPVDSWFSYHKASSFLKEQGSRWIHCNLGNGKKLFKTLSKISVYW